MRQETKRSSVGSPKRITRRQSDWQTPLRMRSKSNGWPTISHTASTCRTCVWAVWFADCNPVGSGCCNMSTMSLIGLMSWRNRYFRSEKRDRAWLWIGRFPFLRSMLLEWDGKALAPISIGNAFVFGGYLGLSASHRFLQRKDRCKASVLPLQGREFMSAKLWPNR